MSSYSDASNRRPKQNSVVNGGENNPLAVKQAAPAAPRPRVLSAGSGPPVMGTREVLNPSGIRQCRRAGAPDRAFLLARGDDMLACL